MFVTPARFAELNAQLDGLLAEAGRAPGDVRRSLMMGSLYGRDEQAVVAKLAQAGRTHEELLTSMSPLSAYFTAGRTREELLAGGLLVGTGAEIVVQLRAYAEAGVQRIMVQWLDLDDIDGLEQFGAEVLRQIHAAA